MDLDIIKELRAVLLKKKQDIAEIDETINNTASTVVVELLIKEKEKLIKTFQEEKLAFNIKYEEYLANKLNEKLQNLIDNNNILLPVEFKEFNKRLIKAEVLKREECLKISSKHIPESAYFIKKWNGFLFKNKRYSYNEFRSLTSVLTPKIENETIENYLVKSKRFWSIN